MYLTLKKQLVECPKRFIISKTSTSPHRKNAWGGHGSDTKLHEETWNAAVTFLGSLCKIHALLFSKIANAHDVRTWKFVCFRKIFLFSLHNTRDVTRGARGHDSPGAESLRRPKSSSNVISTFFQNSTFASERPQVRTWGGKLVSCSRRHLTSLRPCTMHITIV